LRQRYGESQLTCKLRLALIALLPRSSADSLFQDDTFHPISIMRSSSTLSDPLKKYDEKRDFQATSEPKAVRRKSGPKLAFVIQKHWASRLHYDFRLEHGGVLWSWAVPKGPCFDPKVKRMAIHVEDHPVDYGGFEGTIPAKQYGAGTVIVWDKGTWEPLSDPIEGLKAGKVWFRLHGEKLAGAWELVRIGKKDAKADQWILFKKKDEWAQPIEDYDVIVALPDSVIETPLGLLEERTAPPNLAPASGNDSGVVPGVSRSAGAKARLPDQIKPQLATLAKGAPPEGDWIYEVKFDGYRIMARIEKGSVKLFTRGGHDWTHKMKPLAEEIEALGIDSGWLDGEAVVLDDKGVPNFNDLQRAFDASRTGSINYFVFDLPFANGYDLRKLPLTERKAQLRQLLVAARADGRVRYTEHFSGNGAGVFKSACEMGLEGIIAKRCGSTYVSERSESWLKLKCIGRQEFVIVGFTLRTGSTNEVGSLMLGYYEGKDLNYAGNVGTGWNAESARSLYKRLCKIESAQPTLAAALAKPGRWSKRATGSERWVKPELVAEIAFAEWTPDGHVRHASFKGLREDKKALEVTRETPREGASTGAATPKSGALGAIKVSHGERVIDPQSGLTKLDLVRYYESVAKFMMPHLSGRPVSLVRAPSGITGQIFFQKHDDKLSIPGMKNLPVSLWPDHAALLELPTAGALVAAAQMNVIEFHTWNSNVKNIDKPDRIIFDLDPGEGVAFAQLQEAALLTRELLRHLSLATWLKTSGGKGLHLVVPIASRLDADEVKAFSQAVVQHLAKTFPARFVAKSGPGNRVGKIFIDWLRNGRTQTTAAAFSARARPGLGVSMPVSWAELDSIKSGAQWTIANAREYLSFRKDDPWSDYWTCKQTLTKGIKLLGTVAKAKTSTKT
jgi:bifunctional non-homologous end joining protein LigD